MTYNAEKNLNHYMSGKKFLMPEGFRKKFFLKLKISKTSYSYR